MGQFNFAVVSGIASGMSFFLVAAGLTWLFGIMKILNLAHGAFFMLGAYVAFTIMGPFPSSLPVFLGVGLLAALALGVVGYIVDLIVFRRLREVDYHYVLIATFALLMFCEGAAKLIWGVNYNSVMPPPVLDQPFRIAGLYLSRYTLFIIGTGLVVFVALEILIHRSQVGKIMQAVAFDRKMAEYLGINVPLVLSMSAVGAFALAGLAGGILVPNQTLSPYLGTSYLLYAFFAVIIGGLGSIRGAFLASMLLGLVESFNATFASDFPGIAIYFALIACLVFRPTGLLPGGGEMSDSIVEKSSVKPWILPLVFAALALTAPSWAGSGVLFLAGMTLIQSIFALSWNLLFSSTGLVSFGHAGFFAIGAYSTGAFLRYELLPFWLTLPVAMALGALVACLIGLVALQRLAGIFLAVLTVALSEILARCISYVPALGGEDGLSNIPRPSLFGISLHDQLSYYWFLVAVFALVAATLWWLVNSRTGRVFVSIREDSERAAFLSTDVRRYRLIAFVISGAVAALAGSLFAPWTRIVTLDEVHWLTSTQPILATLLGGAGSFWGPVVGSIVFILIDYSTRTLIGLSELIVGGILLAIILIAPTGILGLASSLARWLRRSRKSGPSPRDQQQT